MEPPAIPGRFTTLTNNKLRLILHTHPRLEKSQVGVAIRGVPGGFESREQIGQRIRWGRPKNGRTEGVVEIALPSASAALVMVSLGPDTVRRNWILDPAKAPNLRAAATLQFDRDLRMIRRGLFEDPDPYRFDRAVAALLFMFGFSPALQLETDAPDMAVATPAGRLVLVECTTRTSDVPAKIGKLVDRRGALRKALQSSDQVAEVSAALICRSPRNQVAAHVATLREMNIILATEEDLNEGLSRCRGPASADDILTSALRTVAG